MDENAEIRAARMEEIGGMPAEERAAAIADLDAYLAGRVPEALAQRVQVLPAVESIWTCFWDLDGLRPINQVSMGMGATVPLHGALPWDKVGDWLTERGIVDPQARQSFRRLLRSIDAVFLEHQRDGMSKAAAAEDEQDG